MKKTIWILFFLPFLSFYAYADNTQQGAQDYDWQKCWNDKTSDCKNHCQTSTDKNCSHNCEELATDKCKMLGLSPP